MSNYEFQREKIGDLNCGIVRPSNPITPVRSVAVFCHGYGAGGDDLVGLASELLQASGLLEDEEAATVMVFPEAPLSLEAEGMPEGRAWWFLSIQRLLSAIEDGQYELVKEEVPEGIDAAREALTSVINLTLKRYDLDASHLLLGGFSQGAMLSMDTAVRGLGQPPAALCLYSGCLICERQWRPAAERLRATKIFQSHGRLDPILPPQTGKWLTDLLEQQGCEVDFVEFAGVHTIPMAAIERSAEMLAAITGP